MGMIAAMSLDRADPAGTRQSLEIADFLAGETDRLKTLAAAILGNVGDAEDAVQDTLIAAWRSWSAVRDESKREAWLTTICVRQ